MANGHNYYVNLNDLGSAIAKMVEEYGDKCDKNINNAVRDTAKTGKGLVKSAASSASETGLGHYPSEISYRKRGDKHYSIYNPKRPGLSHLLEKGHRVVNQYGYTGKSARAFPHYLPSMPEIESEFMKNIKKAVT